MDIDKCIIINQFQNNIIFDSKSNAIAISSIITLIISQQIHYIFIEHNIYYYCPPLTQL